MRCWELMHQSREPVENCPAVRMQRSGQRESLIITKDDHWFKVTADPIKDGAGKITGAVHIISDITEQKDTESEKAALEQQLRQAQKLEAIGTLAGGIAHDFNNIPGAIIGFTELARMDIPEGSHARNDLNQALKSALRAKDLVRQILTFSRKGSETLAPVNILPVVKEALKMLRASLPSTIEIRKTLKMTEPVVHSDPTQIHQILMNLCTNAAQAMSEGGGVLEVTLAEGSLDPENLRNDPQLAPGPYLELSVRDTGHGMPPEIREHIFDPYFTTKEKGVGTGLGLSVVHGIVKQHGGLIRVASEPGRGSLFTVFLPLRKEAWVPLKKTDQRLPQGSEHILKGNAGILHRRHQKTEGR